MKASATPLASACLSSAASTCTGSILASAASLAVAALLVRNLIPPMSATPPISRLKYIPCGGQGTAYSSTRF